MLLSTLGKNTDIDYKYSDEEESEEEEEDVENEAEEGSGDEIEVNSDVSDEETLSSRQQQATAQQDVDDDEDEDDDDDDDDDEEGSGEQTKNEEKPSEDGSDDDEDENDEEEDADDDEDEADDDDEDEEDEEADVKVNVQDIFFKRMDYDIGEKMAAKLGEGKIAGKTSEEKWPCLGKMLCTSPSSQSEGVKKTKGNSLQDLRVRKRIADQWKRVNAEFVEDEKQIFTPYQEEMFAVMNSYQDLLYTDRSHKNAEELRNVYCLHILNHVIKSRSTVLKHNSMLSADPNLDSETMRDQGLTRPRVLIVVPFRDAALRIVNTFIKLLETQGTTQHVSHRKRFQDEYSDENPHQSKVPKPEDWEATFSGNTDDHFRIGLAVSRKHLRLYTKFYMSDIIIASPLGLRTVIGTKGEKHQDYDFLSSIEILFMDQADVFLMQNWDHINHLMEYMHLQPQESHDVDFSRVRMWALNRWNKFYRQTVICSSIAVPELKALFNRHCHNYAGRIMIQNPPVNGSICQVVTQLPQVFHKVECGSFSEDAQKRFDFFVKKILPQFRDGIMAGTMIYVPSYFDFVRIRNYFRKQEIKFAQICEYTSQPNIVRARQYMVGGNRHYLVYTERFHFYRRYKLRGITNLIFYQLPSYPHYYSELCNMLDSRRGTVTEHTCMVLYSKYDAHRLAAVVGADRCAHMLSTEKNVHMLVSGEER
ncbi:U3 small nucleolar RNA-associated protein 25 homolog [Amphiura filiformis]|uniref:U3 small nucleolar RNA-associated protein 25 homolog n=1 Tax=Amphiura filiformis TaxID=82378 RepID=UPI003B22687F